MPDRSYTIAGPGPYMPPNYARVVSTLSDDELADELRAERGVVEYLHAVRDEIERRRKARR